MSFVTDLEKQKDPPFSAAALKELAEVLGLPEISHEHAAALQQAARLYWLQYELEQEGTFLKSGELRERLNRALRLSEELRECFNFVDFPIRRILEALPAAMVDLEHLERQLNEVLIAPPAKGPRPKIARTEFVTRLANIYHGATNNEPGLSKHDGPTGPFYRFVVKVFDVVDSHAIVGVPDVIAKVVGERKKSS